MTVNLMNIQNGWIMTQTVNLELLTWLKIYKYQSYGRHSWFHGVPATMRDDVLSYFKSIDVKVKLRYRGPRAHRHYRSSNSRQTTCLREDATSFAVYKD
jgi:hypothetical protein